MKKSILVIALSITALLMSCKTTTSTTDDAVYETQEISLSIEGKRGNDIPAIITLPIRDEKYPLVVMAHGHGGSKEENGGFTTIADALAEKGIAVIRMDFPGCGESMESFENNTLSNMIDDVISSKDYAVNNYNIKSDSIGLFGYSMGGRIVQSILNHKYIENVKSVVLLAPAVDKDTMINFLGGQDSWTNLKETAQKNGSVEFTTIYGSKQILSDTWFEELEAEVPLDDATTFDGIAKVLYSEDDAVVSPIVSKSEAAKLGATAVAVTGDSHSYGFYSDKTDIKMTVVNETVATFLKAFNNQ